MAMYLILTGFYEGEIEKLRTKQNTIYEYVPSPTFDLMMKESNEIINYWKFFLIESKEMAVTKFTTSDDPDDAEENDKSIEKKMSAIKKQLKTKKTTNTLKEYKKINDELYEGLNVSINVIVDLSKVLKTYHVFIAEIENLLDLEENDDTIDDIKKLTDTALNTLNTQFVEHLEDIKRAYADNNMDVSKVEALEKILKWGFLLWMFIRLDGKGTLHLAISQEDWKNSAVYEYIFVGKFFWKYHGPVSIDIKAHKIWQVSRSRKWWITL